MLGSGLKLASKFLPGLTKKGLMKGLGRDALVSGTISAIAEGIGGADPLTALAYGVADAAGSGLAQGGVRAALGKKTGTRELLANIAGSFASRVPVVAAIDPRYKDLSLATAQSPVAAQQTQVSQQNLQRMLINNDLLAGQYMMPGTMYQGLGVQSPQALTQQYLNSQGSMFNMAAAGRDMASIVGV
tara:strand:- start:47 stop:607 length:561 start_codon:yes stop_codon:yes gene_type:complete